MAKDKQANHLEIPERPKSCFTCQQRDRSEWCGIKEEDMAHVNQVRTCNTYLPGQLVFYQGNACQGIYCIQSGLIALRKSDEHGHSVLVRLVYPGQTPGYRAFFGGGEYTSSAEALEPSTVCFIDKAAVRALLDRNPALGLRFLASMAEDLNRSEETFLQTTTLPIRTRLAHLLLTLKERHAAMDAKGTWTLQLPMARQDLAAMLGTRPETLARTITAMEQDNVAAFEGRVVTISDLDKLLDEIEFVDDE